MQCRNIIQEMAVIKDTTPPAKPVAKADITATTNKNVSVSATFAADSVKNEYRVNGGEWKIYSSAVIFSVNGVVEFRSSDVAGNISAITGYTVSNIDKTAPAKPSAKADITAATNKDVTVTATFSSDSAKKEYSLDNKTWKSYTSGIKFTQNGTVYFRGIDAAGNISAVTSYTVNNIFLSECNSNLLSNNISQIVAWDQEKGAVGFMATDGVPGNKWRGIWDWDGKDAELWRVVGVGHFAGSKVDHDGILLYNGIGTTFAAWTNLNDPSYGYVDLCHVEGNFNTKCLTDLDGDKYDDVLIYDEKGSFGVVLDGAAYQDIWHVDNAANNPWQLKGAGDFGGNEEKLIVQNKSGHLYLWTNNDPTFKTWNWSQEAIGFLGNDWEYAGAGDFRGDGTDDIVVRKLSDGGLWIWDDGNSSTAHWVVTPGKGFKVEAIGDYNGDRKEDILVREYNTGWGGLGYYAPGSDTLWNDLNARIETDLESSFAIIA